MSRQRTKYYNAAFSSPTGAGGVGDRGARNYVPFGGDNPYFSQDYVYRWRQYTRLYETSWEARKIINIIPEDALRKEWIAEGIPEEMAKYIQGRLDRLQFNNILKRSLKLERLLGGCLTFMGIDSDKDDPSIKYNPTEKSALRFFNAIPVSRIARMTWDHNPLSEHYMRPESFLINSQEVHVSRCLVWDGEPLFDPYDFALTQFRSNLAGFGPSKLANVWDDIVKAVGTRQAAYQLIQTNNAVIAAVKGLKDLSGTNAGKTALEKVKDIANQLSIYRAALIDENSVDIKQRSASFGSVPELILTFIQILSAASDIPATRFIGQAPGGLNATGESDLENYYNVIDAYQRQRIEPQIRKTYDIIGYWKFKDAWKKERENLGFKFPPLWNQSDLEEADTNMKHIENAMKALDAGLMDENKVIEEMNNRGVFTVDLDEIDENLLDDIDIDSGTGSLPSPALSPSRASSPLPAANPGQAGGGREPNAGDKDDESKYTRREPDGKGGWIYHYNKLRNTGSAMLLIKKAGHNPDQYDLDQFVKGYKVEQEHKDVTKGDPVSTAKIVLAHLDEKPDYYDRLEKVENNNGEYPPPIPVELHGLPFGIENPKGSVRTGIGWEVVMPAHYGHIRFTKGSDEEEIDAYVGPYPESEIVFIIDQKDIESDTFDEHKCIFGCLSMTQAKELYAAGFSDGKGPDRIMSITPATIDRFKQWLVTGGHKIPFNNKRKRTK